MSCTKTVARQKNTKCAPCDRSVNRCLRTPENVQLRSFLKDRKKLSFMVPVTASNMQPEFVLVRSGLLWPACSLAAVWAAIAAVISFFWHHAGLLVQTGNPVLAGHASCSVDVTGFHPGQAGHSADGAAPEPGPCHSAEVCLPLLRTATALPCVLTAMRESALHAYYHTMSIGT